MLKNFSFLILILSMVACEEQKSNDINEINPAAEGFNIEASDLRAIEIADEVMAASGGRENWDNTDYLQWRFFGNRLHLWNKATGDVIIESEKDSFRYEFNIHSLEGNIYVRGTEVSDAAVKDSLMQRGKEFWINDSYWVFLPYKLKDSGVTLKYLGEGKTANGNASDKLQLTFDKVGVTPQNKYVVYVDKESKLITQWDFFANYNDEQPRFSTPWDDYQEYNGLLLSSDRGNNRGMQDLAAGPDLAEKMQ